MRAEACMGREGVEDVCANGLSGENILSRERIVNLAHMRFCHENSNLRWKEDGQLGATCVHNTIL